MLTARELGVLNPNNDVSYYALHCPPPLKNRDFVLQRSWLQTPQEVSSTSHRTSVTTMSTMNGYQLAKRKSLVSFNLCTTATIARPNSQLNINILFYSILKGDIFGNFNGSRREFDYVLGLQSLSSPFRNCGIHSVWRPSSPEHVSCLSRFK